MGRLVFDGEQILGCISPVLRFRLVCFSVYQIFSAKSALALLSWGGLCFSFS